MKDNTSLILAKVGFLKLQTYKLATYINICSSFFSIIIQYYLWYSIYQTNNIAIYSFNQIFLYLCLSQLISVLYPSNISNKIIQYVRNGDITHILLKPLSFEKQFFFEGIGECLYKLFTVSIPIIVVITMSQFRFSISISLFFKFVFIIVLSFIFTFYFEMTVGSLTFVTSNLIGLQSLKYAILTLASGRFIPIAFYPTKILGFINKLPFKMMYDTPIKFVLSKSTESFYQIIFYQFIYIALIITIYKLIYKLSIRKLMIQGG